MFKLVRDKIPEIIKANHKNPEIKVVENDRDYFAALNEKLLEEVNEFIEASCKGDKVAMEEIADILEVIESICKFKKYDRQLIENYKLQKKKERGGFDNRIMLKI